MNRPTHAPDAGAPLGSVPPEALVATRLELHWALQVPAALGVARATPEEDYGHHALSWNPRLGALVGALVPGRVPCRAGLQLAEATLLCLAGSGPEPEPRESFALAGHTLEEGLAWLSAASARAAGAPAAPLARPANELPEHPLASGARFGAPTAAHVELARWFDALAGVLAAARSGRRASPLRVWSHHFDLDTVLALGRESTLGLGFSPGDDSFAEPYLYALPSPAPDAARLPPLAPPAEWITEGWTGAVLRGSALVTLAPATRLGAAAGFYRAAEAALGRAGGG